MDNIVLDTKLMSVNDRPITIKNDKTINHISPEKRTVDVNDLKAVSFRCLFNDFEKKRVSNVNIAIVQRQARYENEDKIRTQKLKDSINEYRNKLKIKLNESEEVVLNELELKLQRERQLDEAIKLENKKKTDKLKETNLKIETENNLKEIKSHLDNLNKFHHHFLQKITEKEQNKAIDLLSNQFKELINNRDQFFKILGARTNITKHEVQIAENFSREMEQINTNFDTEYVKLINKQKDEHGVKQKQLEKEREAIKLQRDQVDSSKPNVSFLTTVVANSNSSDLFSEFVAKDRLEIYIELKALLDKYTEAINPLLKDENLKKYRFDCQKAINIPVNAISAVSSQHLFDKFEKLSILLSGNVVRVGDVPVSASSHPLGQQFCTLLLAKKFVNQADSLISSNPKAAYPLAAVIVALWQKFPDLGKLFLAHLYIECPYLVPYFVPQIQNQSTEDYLKSIGYRYVDGNLETQDMYLKRLTGLVRLYSTIFITKLRRAESNSIHPHCIDNGWKWLTSLLNLNPLPDISATLILEFLQITGFTMHAVYGKQFIKLLTFIHEKYFIKLNEIDKGGPKSRLEGFLLKLYKDGRIEPQQGMLNENFW